MRSFFLITDASIATLGLTMGLVQAVVCIINIFLLDLGPEPARMMPTLLWSTVIFTIVGLLFLGGFWTLLRRRPWQGLVQVVILLSLVPAGLVLAKLMR